MAEGDRRIRRYEVERAADYESPQEASVASVPVPGQVISVDYREGVFYVWMVILPDGPVLDRRIAVFGADEDIPPGWDHWGTVHDGDEAWHFFESPETIRLYRGIGT